jgi:hypothetical protein
MGNDKPKPQADPAPKNPNPTPPEEVKKAIPAIRYLPR